MRQPERLIEPVKQESKKSEAEIKEIVCSVTQRTILKVGVPSNRVLGIHVCDNWTT